MKLFEIQEDYRISGTRYYEIEADTLEAAIEASKTGDYEPFRDKLWESETTGYDDSFQYEAKHEWASA
jgi:hypothetical protein